ncbi:MAG: hypothetical protein B6D59_00170 [Campylobacteraceae bacterium 4484_4]|nr:MAG: hypothetical protein B6D59_00170 [Campylobacteraceae bacterium 4484_4]
MAEKIAIIGAGAAGLVAAITAAKRGREVHLFEKNPQPAKKILASGNGRCNISNTDLTLKHYHGNNPQFVQKALRYFDFQKMQNFFRSIGLLLQVKSDGRAYPLSNEARSVYDLLIMQARLSGVVIHTGRKITQTERNADTGTFILDGIPFSKLLIATGSPAAPQLGADNSGLDLARNLGHTILPCYPTLVGLHLQSPSLSRVAGVKHHAKITLLIEGKKEYDTSGDILFTRYGISGFGILDISTYASAALLRGHNITLSLDMLPEFDRNGLVSQLSSLAKALPDYPVTTLLEGILPSKIVSPLLQSAGVSADLPARSLTPKAIRALAHTIHNWRFRVTDTHGYKHAETSGGGVDTSEIDPFTFESKIVKDLFFAGEVIDIVGDRGGYNLHFAWASGYLAALGMTKKD